MDTSLHTFPNDAPVFFLDCSTAFDKLSAAERKYVLALFRASWYGGLICLHQTSAESPGLFLLFNSIFQQQTPEELGEVIKNECLASEEEWKAFLMYVAQVFGNLGNYLSFGDSKILPNLPEDKFSNIVMNCSAFKNDEEVRRIFDRVSSDIYSLTERNKQIGLGSKGITTYYSWNCEKEDAEFVQKFMEQEKILAENTRLFKLPTAADGKLSYVILQASSEEGVVMNKEFIVNDKVAMIRVERGDYKELMELMIKELEVVQKVALTENERQMMVEYVRSFRDGSVEAHKDGSRFWIKDKGPVVENYIGFIETYRDPFGVRGEFESFVAVVNKEQSAKFNSLVEQAESILPLLPWGKDYEKDVFLRPDFTSLEIVAYANGGVPLGINIPNYDDIRQSEGFKNVSLGNVLQCRFSDKKTTFLAPEDSEVWLREVAASFDIQVGLHELLGHGSGKLFKKEEDGKFNFDSSVLDLGSGDPVSSFYEPGETWDSKFTDVASAYEECRAECVGLYLCDEPKVLPIYGYQDLAAADDVVYVNWLWMARAGVAALELFSHESKSWRQAHSQARYVILRVLLDAGADAVVIEELTGEDGKPDLIVRLDRSKIRSVLKPAIGEFLKKLQLYKSTANVQEGRAMFEALSSVDSYFLRLREVVIARRKPRLVLTQGNVVDEGGEIRFKTYEKGTEGMILSFRERFASLEPVHKAVLAQWERDWPHVKTP